jgi:hypothetical protein
MRDERLIVLLDAYLDNVLTADEKQELERMLLESDAARREFWNRASLHGWTHAAAKLNYGAKPAAEVARERRELRGVAIESFIGWLTRVSRFGWRAIFSATACVAAILMWVGIRALQPSVADDDTAELVAAAPELSNTNFVATLTRGTGVVWDGETNVVEIGSALPSRWLHLKAGAVQIEFYSGARVILEGPSSLELVSQGEARLDYGKLSARVPEPAHGFKVYTPDLTVTDLGTEFGLNLQKAQPAKLEVFEGKVEFATDATNQPRLLNAGAGVKVSARQVEPMQAEDRSDFMSAQELARRESAELRARYQGWRQAGHLLDFDPATLVHLNFEDAHNLDRNLINRATRTQSAMGGMIFGCDWGEGRWPGKAALEFNSISDRVRMPVWGGYESLTYLTWVRVDSLPNRWNALALVDTFKTGETHWQIRRDGSMELSIRTDGGKAAWDHLISAPVITQERFGKWVQLAAVCDGRTGLMSLYFDGRVVASKFMVKKRILTLGNLELGNWTSTAKTTDADYRIRDFHGRMDEFALLSRALSPQEIHQQYELGRPRQATAVAELPRPGPVTE